MEKIKTTAARQVNHFNFKPNKVAHMQAVYKALQTTIEWSIIVVKK